MSFMCRTTPISIEVFDKIESTLAKEVIRLIVCQPTESDEDRELYSLPVKRGGLHIRKPTD